MKTFSNKCAVLVAIGLLALGICQPAWSRPIVGDIEFGGVVTFDTMSLATAQRVNNWNSSFVLQDSGDFAGISPTTNVTMATPWIFNPSTNTPSLWNVGGFTFNLTSSTVTMQTANFLNITGLGTITSTNSNLDPTPGVWTFSSSNSNGANNTTFGFQATTDAVPEPGTIALLSLSGFGVVASRYFRNVPRFKILRLPRFLRVGAGPC